jgi:hypothetical protein
MFMRLILSRQIPDFMHLFKTVSGSVPVFFLGNSFESFYMAVIVKLFFCFVEGFGVS